MLASGSLSIYNATVANNNAVSTGSVAAQPIYGVVATNFVSPEGVGGPPGTLTLANTNVDSLGGSGVVYLDNSTVSGLLGTYFLYLYNSSSGTVSGVFTPPKPWVPSAQTQ